AKPRSSRTMWLLFAAAGIVFAVGARLSRERETPPEPAPPSPQAETHPTAAPPEPPAASRDLTGEGTNRLDPAVPQDPPLRPDDRGGRGKGMLEVVAGSNDTIYVDGTLVGSGPLVKRAVASRRESYEVRVMLRGEERVRFVQIKE